MEATRNQYRGAIVASFLSGPIFVLAVAIAGLSMSIESSVVELELVAPVVAILAASCVIGAIISIVPNLLGTAAMLWLGDHLEDGNLAQLWVVTGGLIAGAAVAPAMPTDVPFVLAFGLTGAASAFICWWGAHDH